MRRLAALVLAASLALTACGSSDDEATASASPEGSIERITIGSSDTLAPSLEFDPGLDYAEPETTVVWDGEGDVLENDQPLLLDLYGQSLVDGTEVINTFDGLPRPFALSPDQLGDDLYQALVGARIGSRLLHVAPPVDDAEAEPPIALVIDVLPVTAQGDAVAPPEGFPAVRRDESGEPHITLPEGAEPPGDLQVATLIQGSGDQVREGSYIVANYKAVHWSDGSDDEESWEAGDVLETSWTPGTAPFETQIGMGAVIAGWDQGLIDQQAGSQVMLVVPPAFGYAEKGTLVFVIDILDVWNPEA